MMIRKLTFGLITMCAAYLGSLAAQTSGTLNGKVTDPDGKPVPSASVMVSGASGLTQTAVTKDDGTFTVVDLPPASYRVNVYANNFKGLVQDNVQVAAGEPVTLPIKLEPGSPVETVEVQGEQSVAQLQTVEMSRVYVGSSLRDVPILDLNSQQQVERMTGIDPPMPWTPFNLESTAPLSVQESPRAKMEASNAVLADPEVNRVWQTNGQQAQANNQKLDGVENMEAFRQIEAHIPAVTSLEQMNVRTSNYEAAEGRAAGTVLEQVTRSGTAGIHGSLFEYNSTNWSQSRNFFDPKPLPQARFTSNKFGGAIGVPIVPNKTFLFLSYEGDYLRERTPSITSVPTAALLAGNFSGLPGLVIANPFTGTAAGAGRTAFSGSVIPGALLNPAALAILRVLPPPNLPGVVNNYFADPITINDGNRADTRLDHRFTDKTTMFLRYGLSYFNTIRESTLPLVGADGGTSRLRSHVGLASFSHAFSPASFTTLRLSIIRYNDPILPLAGLGAAAFGITGGNGGLPFIQIGGMPALGSNPDFPQINKDQSFNIRNDWNVNAASQDLRLGFDVWQVRVDGFQNFNFGPQGGYNFSPGATSIVGAAPGPFSEYGNSLAAFLLGTPTTTGITPTSYLPSYLSGQFGGYASDKVKLGSRLTLDLGVRYDYFGPVEPRNNAANYAIYNPAVNALLPLGTGVPSPTFTSIGGIGIGSIVPLSSAGVTRVGNVRANYLNFAPRVGLVFRFNDRTVVRAGYGMSYWNGALQFATSSLISVSTGIETGIAGGYGAAGAFGALPAVAAAPLTATNRTFYYSPSNVSNPYVEFYNLGVQRDMTHNILAEVSYVGNLSRHLPFTQDTNSALPGTGAAGLPYIGFGRTAPTFLRGTGYTSNYNSLQVNLTKRYSSGVSFSLAYTYSRALDYGAGLAPFMNNINPVAEYGPADFNHTHLLTIAHTIRLPFGAGTSFLSSGVLGKLLGPWNLDGIFLYGTGAPFTPVGSSALCDCPGNISPANYAPGTPLIPGTSVGPGIAGFQFPYVAGSTGFAQPAFGTFGNLGRNSVTGPSFSNYDLAVSRSFVFMENTRLNFRGEAYNIANSPNFGAPVANINSPTFGQATSTLRGMGNRTLQFALRLMF